MYALIWQYLPGSRLVKSLVALLLMVIAVWLLFEYVFPWVEHTLGLGEVTVNQGGPQRAGILPVGSLG
jgi:hypothetical protein